MKKIAKIILSSLTALLFVVPVIAGCNGGGGEGGESGEGEFIDYVEQLHLDMSSNTKKQEVTVKTYIDGDTTHFDPVKDSSLTGYNAADFEATYGYIKARYLAVNTPESTGDVEKWGKTASNFTHDKLYGSTIIVESDDDKWNMDSNDRYTLWIWYRPAGATEFRNLNVELLQYGYGLAQNTETNRYGKDYALPALMQAKAHKLKVYSNDHDENFYEGAAFNLSLKKLRCHIDDYVTKTVRVEGVVTTQMDNNVYIEDYDEETGLTFGIVVFYGFSPGSALRKVLTIGNRVSVHGTVSYSEGFGYQINGVSNNAFHPEYTTNTVVVEKDGVAVTGEGRFAELSAKDVVSGKVEISLPEIDGDGNETEDKVSLDFGEAVLNTTATLKNLKVVDLYTTPKGESKGAISITCEQLDENGQSIKGADGKAVRITVRTTVLRDENDEIVTESYYRGKILTAKGIIDQYDGEYQLKVHLLSYITFQD